MPDLSDPLSRIRRFTLRHRRSLAAAFAALAVLFTLQSLRTETATTPVVVADEPIAAGTILEPSMLTVRDYPEALAPEGALSTPQEATDLPAGAAIGPGEPLTQNRILTGRSSSAPGSVLTPVRIDDPARVSGVEAGDRVTVISTDPMDGEIEVLAREATVEAVTRPSEAGMSTVTLHIAVDEATALQITGTAGRAPLTVLVQSPTSSP